MFLREMKISSKMKDFVGEKIDEAMATYLRIMSIDESQVTQTSVPSDSYPSRYNH